jgi:hypothetical protein
LKAAKDVGASKGTLVALFERIEMFFKRLETYVEVPLTVVMTDLIVKIMVEVLGVLAIATKGLRQGTASESIGENTPHVADSHLERYLNKLAGRTPVEDALGRLDKLTQEEALMAAAQLLKIANNINDNVKGVDDRVKDVDDKMKEVIYGAQTVFSLCHQWYLEPLYG